MMNISNISSFNHVASVALTQGVRSSARVAGASDAVGDGDNKETHVSKSRGVGIQMHHAVVQAFQSLGLSVPQQSSSKTATSGAMPTNQTTGATADDGDSGGSRSVTGSAKKELRQFMHVLFHAVKGEGASDTPGSGPIPTNSKKDFASGLSTLISQVGSGSTPEDLQSAFDRVAADLQPIDGASTSTSSSVTLQALLAKLQQNLGYGASSSSAAVGNLLSIQA